MAVRTDFLFKCHACQKETGRKISDVSYHFFLVYHIVQKSFCIYVFCWTLA